MALAAGTKLGPYQILEPIGAGGMGEVYRARDPRVNRVVAIKVTQERFSDRFQKEAEAIAALNDPHICQLYDVGPNYLVMEFIDGAPLKGPLPVDQTLKYAGQICDALDAAHRNGVTHRDLKPGNILVTKAGVKLLDFGLARMEGGENLTLTLGEVKGTPAYMSPEQWEGQPGDARSDIYAFGCVLYEMLTGKRAVGRRVPAEPAALENLVSTCLARDPEDRWQSAKNLRLALMTVGTTSAAKNPWPKRAGWAITVTAAVFLLLILAPFRRNDPITGRLSRWTVNPPAGTSFATPTTGTVPVAQFALSPDGQALVFSAAATDGRSALWLRSLTETEPRLLPGQGTHFGPPITAG